MTTIERQTTQAAGQAETGTGWDDIAAGYDRTNTPSQMWLGNEGLRLADVSAGMRFLDVAAGSGALSIPAARLGAEVLATDQSPRMLGLLSERARAEELHVEVRVMDGHALQLEANQFDAVGSQFGVMLFPDMPQGIREMHRVLKPGGRVLLSAYGDPHEIEFLGFFIRAIQAVRPDFNGPPMDPPPHEFQLADPARLRQELEDAGFSAVEVHTLTERTTHASGQELYEWIVCSNPIVECILETLSVRPEERNTIRDALEKLVRERAGGAGPATLTNPANIGVGTK